MTLAVRGQIYHVDLGGEKGRHWYVIVSSNERNKRLDSVLGAMITSKDKSHVPTAVPLTHLDSIPGGYILADTIDEILDFELDRLAGVLSPSTLKALNTALRAAFALE